MQGMRYLHRTAVLVRIQADGTLHRQFKNVRHLDGDSPDTSFVRPWITVLNVRPRGRRLSYHVIIMPDCAAVAVFRWLRVWLRWGRVVKEDVSVQ